MKKCWLATVIIGLLFALSGCTGSHETGIPAASGETDPIVRETALPEDETASGQKLQFSVIEAEEYGHYTAFSKEELGGNTDAELTYSRLTEVNVNVNGTVLPLAEAIRSGKLTVPEIYAFARMDAQNGFCEETYTSEHGLTHFTYIYDECALNMAYDVYETPNGKQTLIEEIHIYSIPNNSVYYDIDHIYVDEESEWGYFLDREDWGLTFMVSSVLPTQITIDYTQQQGQEVGELLLEDYMLYSGVPGGDSEVLAVSRQGTGEFPIHIQSDVSGQITIAWLDMAGALEAGEYYVRVTVSDNYDEANVHPLIVKYHDKQSYYIPFSIE